MTSEQGAVGALVTSLVAALRKVPGFSQVSDGVPIQAGDAAVAIDVGPETDWGFKGGEGAELRIAVVLTCGGEAPGRTRMLGERVRAAVSTVGPELGGWRLANMVMLRSRVLRETGPKWTAVVEYRARMTREIGPG